FKEFMAFVTARVLSFVVEQVLFTGAIHFMNDKVAKLLIGVVVIILNYIFSKFWIFKKEK
ncbi:MAG: GtrA family protein, partial [Butyrivibrio hungatei]|nr:GtrA family protein [Butyrivibrio hungatei]